MSRFANLVKDQWVQVCGALNMPVAAENSEGCEFTVGGYYWPGAKNFTWPYYWIMHDRGLTNDGLGPPVRGASCIRAIRVTKPMIAERFLYPLRDLLAKTGHDGLVEVECVVTRNSGDAAVRGIVADVAEERPALKQILNDDWRYNEDDGAPYNYLSQIRLWRLDDPGTKGFAVGRGSSAQRAFKEAERRAADLKIPNLCYRTDGGVRVKDDLRFIETCGWLR